MELMADKKPVEVKREGLSQLATIFDVEGISLDTYVSQTELKKLSEKMGKKIIVTSLSFLIAETGASVVLVINPEEKNKCLLISSNKDSAQSFYDALGAMKEKKVE